MKKLTGFRKIKTAVFISGQGSNLRNLLKFSKTIKSPIIIDLVISNKKAFGLKYADQYKVKKKIISFKNSKIAEKKVVKYLGLFEPDSLVQFLSTDYKIAVSFFLLVVVLIVKPSGIFSGKTL